MSTMSLTLLHIASGKRRYLREEANDDAADVRYFRRMIMLAASMIEHISAGIVNNAGAYISNVMAINGIMPPPAIIVAMHLRY